MSSLLVLLPISLLLLGVAVWAFVWAADHAQFDDLEEAGERILFEDAAREPGVDPEARADARAPEASGAEVHT